MNHSAHNAGDVRCPLQMAQGAVAKGILILALAEQTDEFVDQPSCGHQENGRKCSGTYWSGVGSWNCDRIVCRSQISNFKTSTRRERGWNLRNRRLSDPLHPSKNSRHVSCNKSNKSLETLSEQ